MARQTTWRSEKKCLFIVVRNKKATKCNAELSNEHINNGVRYVSFQCYDFEKGTEKYE